MNNIERIVWSLVIVSAFLLESSASRAVGRGGKKHPAQSMTTLEKSLQINGMLAKTPATTRQAKVSTIQPPLSQSAPARKHDTEPAKLSKAPRCGNIPTDVKRLDIENFKSVVDDIENIPGLFANNSVFVTTNNLASVGHGIRIHKSTNTHVGQMWFLSTSVINTVMDCIDAKSLKNDEKVIIRSLYRDLHSLCREEVVDRKHCQSHNCLDVCKNRYTIFKTVGQTLRDFVRIYKTVSNRNRRFSPLFGYTTS